MLRVEELYFAEAQGCWAIALRPDLADRPKLAKGDVLTAGMRRWTVLEIQDAPSGLIGVSVQGPARLTRGLILRPENEPMGELEYKGQAVLLVRLAKAFRAVDVEGVLARLEQNREAPEVLGVAKTALMAKHLIESGATDEELAAASRALGIGEEL